jgi:hypothetical protein
MQPMRVLPMPQQQQFYGRGKTRKQILLIIFLYGLHLKPSCAITY